MEQQHFLVTATPKVEKFRENATEEKRTIISQHLDYINQMVAENRILFTGSCIDGAMGLIVYKTESYEAAVELFEKDPLTKSGIMNMEIHPFKTLHI
jgi:uncharacterized protein